MNSLKVAKEIISIAKELSSMYWGAPDRTYRMTRIEQDDGKCCCPKCRGEMEKQSFTKRDKIFICLECGFKIPSSKVVTEKIIIEPTI